MQALSLILNAFLVFSTPTDHFVFNNGAEPESLDPHRLTTHNDALLVLQMFEGLLARPKAYIGIQPAMAERWLVSKDGKTYTFTIRQNLKWSNGEPITLEHIKSSLLRAMDPNVGNQYIQWFTDYIEGAAEYVEGFSTPRKKELEAKVGISTKGADQIVINLKQPSVYFLEFLTQPQYAVIHPSMHDANSKVWRTPKDYIVNGPFKMTDWQVNQKIVLEKNPYYREANDVRLKNIVAMSLNDETATLNLYRTKQIDWTGETNLSTSLVPTLRGKPDFKILQNFAIATYLFNTKKKPFDDGRVRKAFSLAVHRGELVDKVLKDGRVPTNRIVPPGVEGYEPLLEPPPPFDKQMETARKLLADAGYPGGKNFPSVTLLYNTLEANRKVAEAVQAMWKKHLGVTVNLQNVEWKVFTQMQSAKQFDISRQTWIGDYPDPANLLEIYITGGGNNHTGWGNSEFDKILKASGSISDRSKRFKEIAKAEKILVDEMPVIPLFHSVYFSLISPVVKGFEPNMFGMYQFRYLTKN